MIEIQAQFDGKTYHPYSSKDQDESSCHKKNQVVTLRITGIMKPHSVKQMNTYWSACAMCAENTDDKHFNTKLKVDMQLRHFLHFVDPSCTIVNRNNEVQFRYLSIAFKNLKQAERTNYFDQAFEQIGKWMGISADQVVEEAKARCKQW